MKRLGDLLIESGAIEPSDLEQALALQRARGWRLGHALLELGAIDEVQLLRVLESQLGIPSVSLASSPPTRDALRMVSAAFARRHRLIPLAVNEGEVKVAMADPLDLDAVDALKGLVRRTISVVVVTEGDLDQALDKYYPTGRGGAAGQAAPSPEPEEYGLSPAVDDSQLVSFTDLILSEAVRAKASDVHIEPQDEDLRIRFRVDGMLEDFRRVPARLAPGVLTRLKALASLDISERRVPQDGHLEYAVAGREVEFRVSTLPTRAGEKMVLRLFDRDQTLLKLDRLGFAPRNLEYFRESLRAANGIVLVTGPTGSGKTTTLYAAVAEFNRTEKNIITVEDPIEYAQPDIVQTAINPKVGFSFATALRALFRQDPDIVLVGEMRDSETARIAVQAALTGHLVLSTLHTNDAPSTLTRLVDMGVEPFLVASVIRCVLAQRLVRSICPHCLTWEEVPLSGLPAALREKVAGTTQADSVRLAKGRGCHDCSGRGYWGRTAIHEVMPLTDELVALVGRGATDRELREAAVRGGMTTLFDDGLQKALAGYTTLQEVYRATL